MAYALSTGQDEARAGVPCGRDAMSRAARLIAPVITGVSPRQQLLSVSAEWSVQRQAHCGHVAPLPRLRTPRHRGLAPSCPSPRSGAADMQQGTLVVFPGGFVLEPGDRRHPCLNIPRSSVLSATFYSDAFSATLTSGELVTVRTDSVEHVDSIFQAYFWNALP